VRLVSSRLVFFLQTVILLLGVRDHRFTVIRFTYYSDLMQLTLVIVGLRDVDSLYPNSVISYVLSLSLSLYLLIYCGEFNTRTPKEN
jgi:hypothetical protein